MSGLARYFHAQGCLVAGYDRTSSPLTQALQEEGMEVIYQDDEKLVPAVFCKNDPANLLIYTPAIPTESALLNFFKSTGQVLHKRAEVLGLLSKSKFTIAVAGTHGKTTTSSLMAHLLQDSGRDCSAFLGGIASNYQTNMLIGRSNLLVVEADEYDRSFLTLHPDIAIVTSTDADHLDIYGDANEFLHSFELFIQQVTGQGKKIIRNGLNLPADVYYSSTEACDAYADNIVIREGTFYFDYHFGELSLPKLALGIPGKHNVENAVAVITAALMLEIPVESIRKALANFTGVKRRFEFILRTEKTVYIDDYAHHPTELRAIFTAVRKLFPTRPLTAVFQPHLYTRTRDFASEFVEALGLVDELILMPIYPARELPIEGVTSEWLLEQVAIKNKRVLNAEQVQEYMKQHTPALVLTVGAGDIDRLVAPFKTILSDGE